ncbi:hypothetical protein BU26DRAFT_320875 [Trematosphaeria pertusa]|uniref:Uncharacterized protein n=1 Tax=Trematosphaeria pertusa TaxID=390896 RepID=A0A6A6IE07_9PLEO|nr:uncharacterized protein BU26DRAFT_320875 [Trematosphaeria pertusa]KAF2247800.1 hypothetical protein BU26DRAFT_320875 [Trematosphaeria pertusa]
MPARQPGWNHHSRFMRESSDHRPLGYRSVMGEQLRCCADGKRSLPDDPMHHQPGSARLPNQPRPATVTPPANHAAASALERNILISRRSAISSLRLADCLFSSFNSAETTVAEPSLNRHPHKEGEPVDSWRAGTVRLVCSVGASLGPGPWALGRACVIATRSHAMTPMRSRTCR